MDRPDAGALDLDEMARVAWDEGFLPGVDRPSPNDLLEVREKVEEAHPPMDVLRKTYQALANFYQIAVGSGEFSSYDFNLEELVRTYKLNALETHHSLRKLETDTCPFANLPEKKSGRWGQGLTAEKMAECRWLRPSLVGQFEFVEWTGEGHLRHSRFIDLRDAKRAMDVVRETT